MIDLIGTHQRLKEVYIKYIESALPLRYAWLNQDRRRLLSQNTLTQWPLLEPAPSYPSSGFTLSQISQQLPGFEDLQYLARQLFPEPMTLYSHQVEALRSVLLDHKDLLVTTGTGSGKTETFLLPLLASLAKESQAWPAMGAASPNRLWWRDPHGEYQPQWSHSRRQHGLRALILYPLNALVEDQLRRLRNTLDHPHTHQWLDRARGGNRILFGRYTGLTPVAGESDNPNKIAELRQYLCELEQQIKQIQTDSHLSEAEKINLLSHFNGIAGGEMWSRWDMQQYAPDILISNYSMLNIILMRQVDQSLLTQTRDYLASNPEHRFYLIVDELHSYRGTPGTEVAYLLRLFLQRIGLSPNSEQLVIMATTASIDQSESSHRFLREFFGRDQFTILSNPQEPKIDIAPDLSDLAPELERFVETLYPEGVENSAGPPEPSQIAQAVAELLPDLQNHPDQEPSLALSQWLQQHQVPQKLLKASQILHAQVRASQVHHLDQLIFPGQAPPESVSHALRGLLIALALARTERGVALQAMRGHLFFNKHNGLSICPNSSCTDPSIIDVPNRNLGALHNRDRINCTCHARLLDLLVCQTCGEVFMGAYYKQENNFKMLTIDQPNLEGVPDRVQTKRDAAQYILLWPSDTNDPNSDELNYSFTRQKVNFQVTWQVNYLDVFSGILTDTQHTSHARPIWSCRITTRNHQVSVPALPPQCPNCQIDFNRKKYGFKTPIKHHDTGFQKIAQVLATSLARELPATQRRLVLFTDSRQDAAKLSAGIEQDHYRDLVRQFLHRYAGQFPLLLSQTLKIKLEDKDDIQKALLAINPKFEQGWTDSDTLARAHYRQFRNLYPSYFNWIDELLIDPESILQHKEFRKLLQHYPQIIALQDLSKGMKQALLELGHNPAGFDQEFQKTDAQHNAKNWYELYDWRRSPIQEKGHLNDSDTRLIAKIEQGLLGEIMRVIFSHRKRCLEALGLAHVSVSPVDFPDPHERNTLNGLVRILGLKWRYSGSDYVFDGANANLPRYAKKIPHNLWFRPRLYNPKTLSARDSFAQ